MRCSGACGKELEHSWRLRRSQSKNDRTDSMSLGKAIESLAPNANAKSETKKANKASVGRT